MNKHASQTGQSILEILIAVAVTAVLLVSLLSLGTTSVKTTSYSRDLNQATKYSNQAADWLRNLRSEIGWITFKEIIENDGSGIITYCFNTFPTTTLEFQVLTNIPCSASTYIPSTSFYREAEFDLTSSANGIINVKIHTYWQGSQEFKATLDTIIAQWN